MKTELVVKLNTVADSLEAIFGNGGGISGGVLIAGQNINVTETIRAGARRIEVLEHALKVERERSP